MAGGDGNAESHRGSRDAYDRRVRDNVNQQRWQTQQQRQQQQQQQQQRQQRQPMPPSQQLQIHVPSQQQWREQQRQHLSRQWREQQQPPGPTLTNPRNLPPGATARGPPHPRQDRSSRRAAPGRPPSRPPSGRHLPHSERAPYRFGPSPRPAAAGTGDLVTAEDMALLQHYGSDRVPPDQKMAYVVLLLTDLANKARPKFGSRQPCRTPEEFMARERCYAAFLARPDFRHRLLASRRTIIDEIQRRSPRRPEPDGNDCGRSKSTRQLMSVLAECPLGASVNAVKKMDAQLRESLERQLNDKSGAKTMDAQLCDSLERQLNDKSGAKKMDAQLLESLLRQLNDKSDAKKMDAQLLESLLRQLNDKSDAKKMDAQLRESLEPQPNDKSGAKKMDAQLRKSLERQPNDKCDAKKMDAQLRESLERQPNDKSDAKTMDAQLRESLERQLNDKSGAKKMDVQLRESLERQLNDKSGAKKMDVQLRESLERQLNDKSIAKQMDAQLRESLEWQLNDKSGAKKMDAQLRESLEPQPNDKSVAKKMDAQLGKSLEWQLNDKSGAQEADRNGAASGGNGPGAAAPKVSGSAKGARTNSAAAADSLGLRWQLPANMAKSPNDLPAAPAPAAPSSPPAPSGAGTKDRPGLEGNTVSRRFGELPAHQKMAYVIMMMTDLANGARQKGGRCESPKDFIKREQPYADIAASGGVQILLASPDMICREILRRDPQNPELNLNRDSYTHESVHQLMTILAQHPLRGDEDINAVKQYGAKLREKLRRQMPLIRSKAGQQAEGDTASDGKTPRSTVSRKKAGPAGGSETSERPPAAARQDPLTQDAACRTDDRTNYAAAALASLSSGHKALQARDDHHLSPPSANQSQQHPTKSTHCSDPLRQNVVLPTSPPLPQFEAGTENQPMAEGTIPQRPHPLPPMTEGTTFDQWYNLLSPNQKSAYIIMMMTDLANRARKEDAPCKTPEQFVKHEQPYSGLLKKKGFREKLLASRDMIWQEILRRKPRAGTKHKQGCKNYVTPKLMNMLAKCPIKDDENASFIRQEYARLRTDLEKLDLGELDDIPSQMPAHNLPPEGTTIEQWYNLLLPNQKSAYTIMMMTDLANRARKEDGSCETPEQFLKRQQLYSALLKKKGFREKLLPSRDMVWHEIMRREPKMSTKYKKGCTNRVLPKLMKKLAKYPLNDDEGMDFIKQEYDRLHTDLEKMDLDELDDVPSPSPGKTPGPVSQRKRRSPGGGSGKSKKTPTDTRHVDLPKDALDSKWEALQARNCRLELKETTFADLQSKREVFQARKCRLELEMWECDSDEQNQGRLRAQIAYHRIMLEQIGLRAADIYLELGGFTE